MRKFIQNKITGPMTPFHAACLGCLSLSLGMFMFGIGNVLIKDSTAVLPVPEVIFFRSFFGIFYMSLFLILTNNFSILKTKNMRLQLIRGTIGFAALYLLFLSFKLLPMIQATVLTFSITLFITLLSVPLLKEKVDLKRGIAVILGFIGVTVAAVPENCNDVTSLLCNISALGIMAALASTSIDSIVMIMSKFLSKTDKPITSVFFHTGTITIIAGLALPLGYMLNASGSLEGISQLLPDPWIALNMDQLIGLAGLGLVSSMGHILIVYAYSIAPAVVVSPMFYTLIIWGAMFGQIFYGESISSNLWIGTPLIVLSGLYIVMQENKHHKKHAVELDPTR